MKLRLDQMLVNRGLAENLQVAAGMIRAGEVYLDDRLADKPGRCYPESASLRLRQKPLYVSRGGVKLAAALAHFNIKVAGSVCADIGASSGGFTDCLLQNGARQVFAVDVNYGQLAWTIRQNPRVTVLERCNARNLTAEAVGRASIDLAVIDLSFISLTAVLPAIIGLFPARVSLLALVKPQFELAREEIGPGGVVVDPALHNRAIDKISDFVTQQGLVSNGSVISPITGPKGNREFFLHVTSPPAHSAESG